MSEIVKCAGGCGNWVVVDLAADHSVGAGDERRWCLRCAGTRIAEIEARTDRLARAVRAETSFDEANDADPDTGAGHEILKDWDAIWQERDAAFAALLLPGDLGEGEDMEVLL